MAIPLVLDQIGPFAAEHSCTRTGNQSLQATVVGDISMKLTFAPSATVSYHRVARTAARTREKNISVPVSPVTGVAANHPTKAAHPHKRQHFRRGCSLSWRQRKIALGRMEMRWNARSAWWNMRLETSWLVWSACVSSTSSVLWSGLNESRSVLFTRSREPMLSSISDLLYFFV